MTRVQVLVRGVDVMCDAAVLCSCGAVLCCACAVKCRRPPVRFPAHSTTTTNTTLHTSVPTHLQAALPRCDHHSEHCITRLASSPPRCTQLDYFNIVLLPSSPSPNGDTRAQLE